jgi:hypothetical protein
LGSDNVVSFYTYFTLPLFFIVVILILLVWRIGYGMTELELVQCDANGSRLCSVRCWKPMVCYHTQI